MDRAAVDRSHEGQATNLFEGMDKSFGLEAAMVKALMGEGGVMLQKTDQRRHADPDDWKYLAHIRTVKGHPGAGHLQGDLGEEPRPMGSGAGSRRQTDAWVAPGSGSHAIPGFMAEIAATVPAFSAPISRRPTMALSGNIPMGKHAVACKVPQTWLASIMRKG